VRGFYQPSTFFLFLFSCFRCTTHPEWCTSSLQPHERASETFQNSVLLPAYEHGPTQRTGPLRRVYIIYPKHMHVLLIVMIITNGSP
jgi:hypothetical protein